VVGLGKTKTDRDENLTKHTGSIHAYVKKEDKNRKSNYDEGGKKQKKQYPRTEMKNNSPFSL